MSLPFPSLKSVSIAALFTASMTFTVPALADEDGGVIGPWRVGDFAVSKTLADDRPNDESREIVSKDYRALVPERLFKGEKGVLGFRVTPRSQGWAGILVVDSSGKPVPRAKGVAPGGKGKGYVVKIADPARPESAAGWTQHDTNVMFSDASKIVYPRSLIIVTDNNEVVDQAVVDFSQWKLEDSTVVMSSLLEGPTSQHGTVISKDGQFIRGGKPMFFWGGHENHIASKGATDAYVEAYAAAGINVMRNIGIDEMLDDPETGSVNKGMLDNYHYQMAKLGERGIYFFMSAYPGYVPAGKVYGYAKGQTPNNSGKVGDAITTTEGFWVDPKVRQGWKTFLRNVLTAPNPYAGGKAFKDDPSLIGFELANEVGLNPRRFDFNRLDVPDVSLGWRELFNKYLVKKYGGREKLAQAWQKHPLAAHEDPAKGTILFPTNFRGARSPYGGTGQHDQFTTAKFANNGWALPPEANPRIVDAIEFNNTVAKKPQGFDFNNLSTPDKTLALRMQFNEFLLKKYGSREKLAQAWADDPLFPWESPDQPMVKDKPGRDGKYVPDPTKPKQTILIPSNFHGETEYKQVSTPRVADPRVGDAMEFTYTVQRDWATDMAKFLKEEIGLKCGIGWNGDTFHVGQLASHMANMDSPLDVAIAAAYMDSDNGDQLTSRVKNLKRFNAYGRILGRPMFAYEWSYWGTQGPFAYEYGVLAALMGREYGFDGYAHHKMAAFMYPVSDPVFSTSTKVGHYITPLTDRPRRGAFYLGQWIMARSKIQEADNRLIVGFPFDSAFTGEPERRMSNWAFENWLMYQIGIEDHSFKDVYDGPTDRVVIHSGHGPYGDYRKAKHAILWCHSDSGRDGQDPKAKEKWFAMHGIRFEPGQKYFVNDQFFATTEDLTDYNVVHRKAESARHKLLDANAAKADKDAMVQIATAADDYWAAEPDAQPTELDRQLYAALKKWDYPVPFAENEIDKVWRSRDRSMVMDSTRQNFTAKRADMEIWLGKAGANTQVNLNALSAKTDEKQFAIALLPWDTADFSTAKTLAVWCMWNGDVTVKLPASIRSPKVYAVNWLGKRIFEVKPSSSSEQAVSFRSARHDDIFCYEIVAQ